MAGAGDGETVTPERLAEIKAWLAKYDDGRVIRYGDMQRPQDTFMTDGGSAGVNAMRTEVFGIVRDLLAEVEPR